MPDLIVQFLQLGENITHLTIVIIVGGLLAAGPTEMDFSKLMGFLAVTLASVNIFGGFIVTNRMLGMFKKKKN